MLFTLDEVIDCQKFADLAGARFDADSVEGQKGPIYYCKTHSAVTNFPALADKGRCLLVTSSSDSCVTEEMVKRLPKNVVRWFSTNVVDYDPVLIPIPIGFIFNSERSKALIEQQKKTPGKYGLMYINFTRRPGDRDSLYVSYENMSWVTIRGGKSHDDLSPADFYMEVAQHHYVLSPAGAGPDCHRTWEAMALGSVPVVIRSSAMRILNGLPCLQVSSWRMLNQSLLENQWPRLVRKFGEDGMEKLRMSYWKDLIQSWVSNL